MQKKSNKNRVIQFSPPDIGEDEIEEVIHTLRSGWITTGPKTKEFERQIAEYCHTQKAVCLNSATACLEMTLRLFGIGEGDEVIVSAYTYTASASVICHVGATPVMIDTAKDSFLMDYDMLERKISSKTKAILCVDLAGIMCDYQRIFKIVDKSKDIFYPKHKLQDRLGRILVLADAAHAFGAVYHGKRCGEVADFTCFSFHAVKNLTTSEGGCVVWNEISDISSEDIYKEYMLLSLHGQSKDALAKTKVGAWEYDIMYPAYKCNMTDIMASIGLAQIRRYPKLLEKRHALVDLYNKGIEQINQNLDGIFLVPLSHKTMFCQSSCHLYMVRIIGGNITMRNKLINNMAKNGVCANVHYKPLPMLTAYKELGYKIEDFKNALAMYETEFTLPLHTGLSDEDVIFVLEKLEEAIGMVF